MTKRLVFPKAHTVELENFSLPKLAANEVLVKNKYTLMSTGTENIAFNHMFEEGTHWAEWVKYPFYPGYAAIGEVTETGSNVEKISKGDTVIHRGNHASAQI